MLEPIAAMQTKHSHSCRFDNEPHPRVGLNFLDGTEISRIISEDKDASVFFLEKEIINGDAFYQALRNSLPQDPPLQGNHLNWDALMDSVWGGIFSLNEKKIFIVWAGHEEMEKNDNGNYVIACEFFESMANSLTKDEYTTGKPIKLSILVEVPRG